MLLLPSQKRLDCNIGSVFAAVVTTFAEVFRVQFCQHHLQNCHGPYMQEVFVPVGFF
jgi:hypothetical protein